MKQVVITIDQIGNPTIEAKGFNGVGCKAATKALEEALSNGKVETNFKPEYSQGSAQEQVKVNNW